MLCMFSIKWQTHYNLKEITIPVSTRDLLLMLENIKNNTEVDYKAQTPIKARGLNGSARWSQLIPESPRSPRRSTGPTDTVYYARRIVGHAKATTGTAVFVLRKSVL